MKTMVSDMEFLKINQSGSSKTVNSAAPSSEEVKKLGTIVKKSESQIEQMGIKAEFMKKQYKIMENRFNELEEKMQTPVETPAKSPSRRSGLGNAFAGGMEIESPPIDEETVAKKIAERVNHFRTEV